MCGTRLTTEGTSRGDTHASPPLSGEIDALQADRCRELSEDMGQSELWELRGGEGRQRVMEGPSRLPGQTGRGRRTSWELRSREELRQTDKVKTLPPQSKRWTGP